ncbi:MAG: 4Fe-4S dicluster domain-containing protein [bacterium]
MGEDRASGENASKTVPAADSAGAPPVLDFEQLKSGGIIKQRQRDMFTVRLRVPGGRLPISRLKKIVESAEKHAHADYVHISFRQSVEIPYVDYRAINALKTELAETGQEIASCGARVRVPTACSGCEYNPNGLVDTQKMVKLVHDRFFGEDTPHKFKVNFSGCPIDCARTSEADLGFQGAIFPRWEAALCIGCTICERSCREGAIRSDDEGRPIFDPSRCLACADCIRNCPSEAWLADKTGYIVRAGGRHGRHPHNASIVARFAPEESLPGIIEKTLEWYRANASERKRFGDVLREKGMKSYMTHMKDAFGECAVENPPPPEPVDIHFQTKGR